MVSVYYYLGSTPGAGFGPIKWANLSTFTIIPPMKESALLPISAVMFGVVLAVAGGLPIQAAMNVYETRQCKEHTQSHKLITVRGFWGDTKHCVDRRYL